LNNLINQYHVRVLAVIVLYKMRPSESVAFRTLQAAISALHLRQDEIRVLLYDNTPGGCDPGPLPEGVQYEAAKQNAGLAAAYNCALAIALGAKYTWLLTLDQDTTLPTDYLSRMSKIALEIESDNRVAAIVPRLLDAGRSLSPLFFRFWGVSYLSHSFEGIPSRDTYALNSASLFRVSALKQIGGFNPYFWLDYLDTYVYRQFHLHGRNVYVAGDIQVEHELSLHGGELRPDRFRNYLQVESAFCDLYRGNMRGLALTVRLFGRIWRHQTRGVNAAIRQLTWNALKKRVFQSRKRRIQDWKSEMEQRMLCCSGVRKGRDLSEKRPSISVCMAAYNGERYITAQLLSILSQLAAEDEVIVVDDASTDGTRERVQSLQDGRIRLIEHSRNMGVSRTFEDAIRGASGMILFLSDQDDLWVADKVSTILQQFQDNPSVTLVASDAAPIDQGGNSISESYLAGRGNFSPGLFANLIRNHYIGCTLAFRASLGSEFLPLPHRFDILHDIWIGVRNSLARGQAVYIDRPLILYRRHPHTVTGRKGLTLSHRIRVRLHLLLALAEFSISKRIKM
jgi:glycosyltransferase involved in cell wall biosynthesis